MKRVMGCLIVLGIGLLISQKAYSQNDSLSWRRPVDSLWVYDEDGGKGTKIQKVDSSDNSGNADSLNHLAWWHFARTDSNAFYVVKDTTKVDHIRNFPTIQEAINAAGAVASATKPCVVRIEPGIWPLDSNIKASNYVSLEGYGAKIVPDGSFSGSDKRLLYARNCIFKIRGLEFDWSIDVENVSAAQALVFSGGKIILRDIKSGK